MVYHTSTHGVALRSLLRAKFYPQDIQSKAAKIRRGKEERRKKETTGQKMVCPFHMADMLVDFEDESF